MTIYVGSQKLHILILVSFLPFVAQSQSALHIPTQEQYKGLSQFFGSVDRDGDGQIEPTEALTYLGANFDESDIGDKTGAAKRIYQNLEGGDADATISKAEVEKHLRRLLKASITLHITDLCVTHLEVGESKYS